MATSTSTSDPKLDSFLRSLQTLLTNHNRDLLKILEKESGSGFSSRKSLSSGFFNKPQIGESEDIFNNILEELVKVNEKSEEQSKHNQTLLEKQNNLFLEMSKIEGLSKKQLEEAKGNIKKNLEIEKLKQTQNEARQKLIWKREDEDRKIEREFYDLGFKSQRKQKSFLQRVFEARKSGSGILGALTKATLGTIYQNKLAESVDSIKTIANAFRGRVGTGTRDWAREMLEEKKAKADEKFSRKEFALINNAANEKIRLSIRKEKLKEFEEERKNLKEQNKLFQETFKILKRGIPKIEEEEEPSRLGTPPRDPSKEAKQDVEELKREGEEKFRLETTKTNKSVEEYLQHIYELLHNTTVAASGKRFHIEMHGGGGIDSKELAKRLSESSKPPAGPGLISSALSFLTGGVAKGGGLLARGAGLLGKGITRLGIPAAIAYMGYRGVTGALEGGKNAEKIFGKRSTRLTLGEGLSASTAGALSSLSFGYIDQAKAAKRIHAVGSMVQDYGKQAIKSTKAYFKDKGTLGGKALDYVKNIGAVKTASKFFEKRGIVGGASKIGSTLWDMGSNLWSLGTKKIGKPLGEKAASLIPKSLIKPVANLYKKAGEAGSWIKSKATGAISTIGKSLGITDLLRELIELIKKIWTGFETVNKYNKSKLEGTILSRVAAMQSSTAEPAEPRLAPLT